MIIIKTIRLCSFMVFGIGLSTVIGYAFNVQKFYSWGEGVDMALSTGICFTCQGLSTYLLSNIVQDCVHSFETKIKTYDKVH